MQSISIYHYDIFISGNIYILIYIYDFQYEFFDVAFDFTNYIN